MIIDLNYIRNYLNKLDKITGFNSKDIKLEISKRLTKTFAYMQMNWDENHKLVNDKMVCSEAFLNCNAREEILKSVIRHEYCHAWSNYGQSHSFSHCSDRFIEKCNKLKCHHTAICYDEELNNKFKKCIEAKDNSKEFNYRKDVFNKMMCMVYKDNVNIRCKAKINEKLANIKLTITEKYNEDELKFLFEDAVKKILKELNLNNNIKDIITKEYIIGEHRKIDINYNHENIRRINYGK